MTRQSSRKEVASFLDDVKKFLQEENFNIDTDFILISKTKPYDIEHSTPYTLLELGYNREEVVDVIRELTIAEYSETKIDIDDINEPYLYVFGKYINRKLVYIKFKVKEEARRHIVCVSFHFANMKMSFPYA